MVAFSGLRIPHRLCRAIPGLIATTTGHQGDTRKSCPPFFNKFCVTDATFGSKLLINLESKFKKVELFFEKKASEHIDISLKSLYSDKKRFSLAARTPEAVAKLAVRVRISSFFLHVVYAILSSFRLLSSFALERRYQQKSLAHFRSLSMKIN